jgi:hypothetical protein
VSYEIIVDVVTGREIERDANPGYPPRIQLFFCLSNSPINTVYSVFEVDSILLCAMMEYIHLCLVVRTVSKSTDTRRISEEKFCSLTVVK